MEIPLPIPDQPRWFTSSYTANNGACVECAELPHHMAVRDTKDRQGPVLRVDHHTWHGFITGIKHGEFHNRVAPVR